jgi:hypothetical protein
VTPRLSIPPRTLEVKEKKEVPRVTNVSRPGEMSTYSVLPISTPHMLRAVSEHFERMEGFERGEGREIDTCIRSMVGGQGLPFLEMGLTW